MDLVTTFLPLEILATVVMARNTVTAPIHMPMVESGTANLPTVNLLYRGQILTLMT